MAVRDGARIRLLRREDVQEQAGELRQEPTTGTDDTDRQADPQAQANEALASESVSALVTREDVAGALGAMGERMGAQVAERVAHALREEIAALRALPGPDQERADRQEELLRRLADDNAALREEIAGIRAQLAQPARRWWEVWRR